MIINIILDILKIIRWHIRTLPKTKPSEQLEKVRGEINEYIDAFNDYTKARNPTRRKKCKRHMEEELIDVIISSINCMRYKEIREKVAVKMAINRHRTFEKNHHIGD